MFPETNITETTEETTASGKSFLFDFEKGDFITADGKLVEASEIEAVKVWIQKILKTEKYKFKIYDTGDTEQYGITLMDFVAKGYPQVFVEVELRREITEALLKNTEITSIGSFEFSRKNRTLNCNFTVKTIYGSVESGVII